MADAHIAAFREFNRFHTRLVGALNERMLASDYTLPQVRVLYEVANAAPGSPPSAHDLSKVLRTDKGYLSRIVTGLVNDGLIERQPDADNAKRLTLSLTRKGEDVFAALNTASAQEAAGVLSKLTPAQRQELVRAMDRIRQLLGDKPGDRAFILRDPEPGDLGWITSRQAQLYANEYGWDWTFEALVADIVSQFVNNFDAACERCWIAECDGGIVGSVFVVRQDAETAKLRLLYVDVSMRGLGLGRKLVEECIRFARSKQYKRLTLWTNDVLVSARRIYEAAGFELVDEEPHHSFGKDLVGQNWTLDL